MDDYLPSVTEDGETTPPRVKEFAAAPQHFGEQLLLASAATSSAHGAQTPSRQNSPRVRQLFPHEPQLV